MCLKFLRFVISQPKSKLIVFKSSVHMIQGDLEPVCCKEQQKSSWPVTGLWNRPYKILNDIKLILDDILSVWNHSGPSEVPYSE